jgi:hypothetical protein
MTLLHIIGGSVGLLSGAVALIAGKGSKLHRKSGTVFVFAMLVLSASGTAMAALMLERVSIIAGMLTFYLVITAWLTVRRRPENRWADLLAMLLGLTIILLSAWFGIEPFANPEAASGEMIGLVLVFGFVALVATLGDLRFLLTKSLPWKQTIARHLWRMCLALWIATASFFLGQSDELPAALRIMPLLSTPVLAVFLLMFYWLARVLFTQWRPQV